jgi:hypothetical protein
MVDSQKSCNIECLCYLTHMNNVHKQNKTFRNKILFAILSRVHPFSNDFVHGSFAFKAIIYHVYLIKAFWKYSFLKLKQ